MFFDKVSLMEQRLGTIVCRAFEDCGNCEAVFKVHITVHEIDNNN